MFQIRSAHIGSWYSYVFEDVTYFVLLNDQRSDPLTTRIGSDGSAGEYDADDVTHSVLYRWQGTLVPVQVSTAKHRQQTAC